MNSLFQEMYDCEFDHFIKSRKRFDLNDEQRKMLQNNDNINEAFMNVCRRDFDRYKLPVLKLRWIMAMINEKGIKKENWKEGIEGICCCNINPTLGMLWCWYDRKEDMDT